MAHSVCTWLVFELMLVGYEPWTLLANIASLVWERVSNALLEKRFSTSGTPLGSAITWLRLGLWGGQPRGSHTS